MKKIALAAACLLAFTIAPAAAQRVEQVHFARGASGTTIDGSIVGRDYVDYHLTLAAGQMLSVSLQERGGSPYFNVIEPGAGDVAIYNSSINGQTFEARTRVAGTYTIRVYQMRAAERRGERASYRLSVTAVGGGAAHHTNPVAIRGAGGLEEKCRARINEMTGGNATGTNHIEESEAAIAIYINVKGAEAPWRCLAYRDGTIGEVMYTGSEGAM